MPPAVATPHRSPAFAAALFLGIAWLGGAAIAEDAQTVAAQAIFNKVLSALNASSASSISGCIADGQMASFTLKSGGASGNHTAAKAAKELQKWFDAGAKGGGWKKIKVQTTGSSSPWATFERKSDGRQLTVTLKYVKTKLYLLSFVEK